MRAVVGRERVPLIVGIVVLLFVAVGFVAYPTLPSYDSMWSLVWAQEMFHGELPSFDAYRAPTEHPLGLVMSLTIAPLGETVAPRAFVAITLLSFVALLAAMVRLGALTLGLLAGLIAAALLLTRLNFAFLAAFGYFDVPFLALLVWAAALVAEDEGRRVRQRPLVWALLIAAGLLRPEAWAFAILYGAWTWRAATTKQRMWVLLAVAAAPLLWALTDLAVTGDPAFSLTYSTDHAAQLGRNRGLLELPRATLSSAGEFVKPPVLAAACIGIVLALWRRPGRAVVPLVLTAGGVATFLLVSQQGFSVIPRYFALAAVGLCLFAGHAVGGWELLRRGSPARRWWIVAALPALVAGGAIALVTLNPAKVDAELRLRERVFGDLAALLDTPAVRAGRRCGPVSVPNHKLAPYVRWWLDAGRDEVIARSDRRALARAGRGVALEVRDVPGLRAHAAFGPRTNSEDSLAIGPAPAGFRRAAERRTLIAWVRC
jgi:hypothetical protein